MDQYSTLQNKHIYPNKRTYLNVSDKVGSMSIRVVINSMGNPLDSRKYE